MCFYCKLQSKLANLLHDPFKFYLWFIYIYVKKKKNIGKKNAKIPLEKKATIQYFCGPLVIVF